jgi:hypothetical protein
MPFRESGGSLDDAFEMARGEIENGWQNSAIREDNVLITYLAATRHLISARVHPAENICEGEFEFVASSFDEFEPTASKVH